MIHHFYHIYADGNWQQPVEEHVRALKESEFPGAIYVGIVGSPENRASVKTWLSQRIEYTVIAEAGSGWEQTTLIPMHEFSQHNEGLILYAHTKGSHDGNDVNVRWRRSMTYWHIIRWRDCVSKLKDHEVVATHWIYPLISMPEHIYGNPMSAGNFWWCRAELMRTWMKPTVEHRHAAEGWIGYKYVQKPCPLWDWTPYFPNTNHFADGWIDDPNFVGVDTGASVEPIVLHGKEVPNE